MPAATTSISRIAERVRAALLVALPAALSAVALAAQGTGSAQAMTFAVETAEQGRKVVVARGVIDAGDAQRLRDALRGADRDGAGYRQLVLESLGGNVAEAFAMAEVMDAEQVTTRVRAGKSCASACAVIVFAAGIDRIVDEGGRLGIHTCYDRAGARSTSCNEIIANAAQKHGVPFIATFTLMQLTAPGSVRWLDAENAACWRLSRDPAPPPGRKPPPADPSGCPPPLAEPAKGPGLTPVGSKAPR